MIMQKEKNFLAERQISIEIQHNEEKLAMISKTIENQKARIKHLTQVNLDPEQLENERIAKKRLESKAKLLICRISDLRAPNCNVAELDDKKLTKPPNEDSYDITSKNTGLILQNLANKERQQYKIKESLEQIKIQQLEQELQIKEAATRRKLLALKQQLRCDSFSENDIPRKTHPLPTSSHTDGRKFENQISNNLYLDPNSFHHQSTRTEAYTNSPTTKNYGSPNVIDNIVKRDYKFIPQPPAEKNIDPFYKVSKPRTMLSPDFRGSTSEPTKLIPPRENAAKITKTTDNDSKSTMPHNSMKVEEKPVNSHEKAYMNAVQTNRTRVQKIRRVINAAQVIQRNWRKYKLRTK